MSLYRTTYGLFNNLTFKIIALRKIIRDETLSFTHSGNMDKEPILYLKFSLFNTKIDLNSSIVRYKNLDINVAYINFSKTPLKNFS